MGTKCAFRQNAGAGHSSRNMVKEVPPWGREAELAGKTEGTGPREVLWHIVSWMGHLSLPSRDEPASVSREYPAEAGWGCHRKHRPRKAVRPAGFPQSLAEFPSLCSGALYSDALHNSGHEFSAVRE